jgi:cell shape-determining protein MreC
MATSKVLHIYDELEQTIQVYVNDKGCIVLNHEDKEDDRQSFIIVLSIEDASELRYELHRLLTNNE